MGFMEVTGNGILWEGENEYVLLQAYGNNCFRFQSSVIREHLKDDWTLLPPGPDECSVKKTKNGYELRNGILSAKMEADGTICYLRNNVPFLQEDWKDRRESLPPIRRAREYRLAGGDSYKTDLYFKANEDEHFYGMGQHADDCFDIKGCTIELAQKNTQTIIPYVMSSLRYGFVWNNPAVGRAEFVKNHTLWHADATKKIDYLIFCGDTPSEINTIYGRLYGTAPEFPEWASGFWQSKLRYETQQELLESAREHVVNRKLPMDVIVVDFYHWSQHGEWKFNPECWPDPEKMSEELNRIGVKLAVSIWPTMDQRSENYPFMKEHNMLMRTERNAQVVKMSNGPQIYVDLTYDKARQYMWNCVEENYLKKGVKVFWLDESEPGMIPYDYDNVRYRAGNGLEVSCIYPYYYAKGFYEGQKHAGQSEIVNLIRSAWLGSQKYGVVLWSGDVPSTFESLKRQIKVGLSVAVSGIPWWTTDIGGFFDGDKNNPEFRELLVRWFEFGAFCPVFRIHGNRFPYSSRPNGMTDYTPTSGDNQVWSFGEEAYGIMCYYLQLRERLKPYISKTMHDCSLSGLPVMKPLFYQYPEDEICWSVEDSYMFGDDILVAPIYEYRCRSRKVYLPENEKWINVYSGECYEGAQWVHVDAQLDKIPVFVRKGAGELAGLFR
ncbi:glycoside hydrolase family 31 protein [Clostridiales bacterium TF09-2AC]|nr:glycoside hydrolase family 31 protein [Clostridiales bacterium TF09-2AC]